MKIMLLLLIALLPAGAFADESTVYTVHDEHGQALFSHAGTLSEGDEYISADNTLYRITQVSQAQATAVRIGEETMPDVSWLDTGAAQAVFADMTVMTAAQSKDSNQEKRKLIAMYVTHSDESYIPSDGTQSIEGQGGIYDVARSFRDALQAKGVDVILDESTPLPHDSGAYRRSRRTAARLLQKRPDAIIDIHRDGIPDPDEYVTKIDGENASKIRLLVGRSNQNSEVNRTFAKQIKAVADKKYPGLIKDIFIGKGNYNQDLSPNAILLEFGTHTISKERVLQSTDVMADVVSTTLYGPETGSAKSADTAGRTPENTEKDKSSFSSMALVIAIVIIGALLFALMQTGSAKGAGTKLARNLREMTGGMIGKKKDKT